MPDACAVWTPAPCVLGLCGTAVLCTARKTMPAACAYVSDL